MRILLAACVLLGAPDQQADKKFPVRLDSAHFSLKSTASKERAQELLDSLELAHAAFLGVLEPVNPEGLAAKKVNVVFYRDLAEFIATGGGSPGIGAFTRGTTITGGDDGGLTKNSFAHELVHVLVLLTSKNDLAYQDWFAEGFADALGNSEVRDGKIYLAAKSGAIARMRMPILQEAVRNGTQAKLSDLLTMSTERFMKGVPLSYAHAWSFCHFLLAGPAEEDRSRVLPEGRYRKNLMAYYKASRDGGLHNAKAWAQAFKGISTETLEKEWKEYVLAWRPERVLGIRGREVALDPEGAGIEVESVVAGGAADKAGIQKGDVVLAIGGRRFGRGAAMAELQMRLQDGAVEAPVKLSVRRGAEELAIEASWSRP